MVTTNFSSVISSTWRVLGKLTSMPDWSTGAVIIKLISKTRTTSTSGVMLMSARELCVLASRLTGLGMVFSPESGVELLGADPELHGEVVHNGSEVADTMDELVVSDQGGDGGKEAGGGGDQSLGNARGDGPQGCGASRAQS